MEREFVNLTPHDIEILEKGSNFNSPKVLFSLPPSGVTARVIYERGEEKYLRGVYYGEKVSIPVFYPKPLEVRNLPDPFPGKVFIVSKAVAEAVKELKIERDDLYVLYDILRDRNGQVLGGKALSQIL